MIELCSDENQLEETKQTISQILRKILSKLKKFDKKDSFYVHTFHRKANTSKFV